MQPAVFLDRDNTLITNDGDLGDPDAVELKSGVPAGLKALREAGFRLIVVTNQAGVARGVFNEDDVDAVHQRIASLVNRDTGSSDLIDRFYYCPYHPEAKLADYRRDHPWRKPHPGMLLQAARDMSLDLSHCWMVGDQERDIAAGQSAGCRTVLVGENATPKTTRPTITVRTFPEAVNAILKEMGSEARKGNAGTNGTAPSDVERVVRAHLSGPKDAASGPDSASQLGELRRAVQELTEELRSERLRRAEFTGFRLAAGLCQLFALLLALLGLLQIGSTDVFVKWMIGAALAQLLTVSILLLDLKG